MATSDWRLEGEWIKNCNCAFGCPCDFNARPTEGYCEGLVGMRITKGHFENTKLDGVVFAAVVHFPGALHEGNGQLQPIIDERATPEQREALFNIMSGKNSAEGTLFQILSLIVTKMHEPLFVPIEFSFDKNGRVARVVAKGVLETDVEPIKNPVTGAEVHPGATLPEGIVFKHGDFGSSTTYRLSDQVSFEHPGKYTAVAPFEYSGP